MENHLYRTANTALATYLQSEGFSLLEVTTQPNQYHKFRLEAVFVFEDSQKLHDAVWLWDTAKATGNHNLFYHQYKATVKKAKMAVAVANAPQEAGGEHGRRIENKCDSSVQVAPPAPTSYRR
jgi:hypothetical protein